MVNVALPLGDITANQLRSLADIARRFTNETIRDDGRAEYRPALGQPGRFAGNLQGARCRGTRRARRGNDRGYRHLPGHGHLQAGNFLLARAWPRNCASGWPRRVFSWMSRCKICTSRSAAASTVAASITWRTWAFTASAARCRDTRCRISRWFWEASGRTTGGTYGLPVIAIPSKNIPEVVTRLTDRYAASRQNGESFKDFIKRIGKVELKKMLEDLARPPADPSDRSYFSDWGDPREYSLLDMGIGECAGEVVSAGRVRSGRRRTGTLRGAGGLGGRPDRAGGSDGLSIHAARREGAGEDRNAGHLGRSGTASSANSGRVFTTRRNFSIRLRAENSRSTCLPRRKNPASRHTPDSARYLIDEAQLFIDAAHSCYNRIATPASA